MKDFPTCTDPNNLVKPELPGRPHRYVYGQGKEFIGRTKFSNMERMGDYVEEQFIPCGASNGKETMVIMLIMLM